VISIDIDDKVSHCDGEQLKEFLVTATELEINKLPGLVRDHLRWSLYLGALRDGARDLSGKSGVSTLQNARSVFTDDFLMQLGRALFNPKGKKTSNLRCQSLSSVDWRKYFARELKKAGSTGPDIPNVYQCRAFYGLKSPNNLLQRLSLLFERALAGDVNEPSKSTDGHPSNRRVAAWGDYAKRRVESCQGWDNFISTSKQIAREDDGKRILALDQDRYLQILLAPVGCLWHLWFLADNVKADTVEDLLRKVAELPRDPYGATAHVTELFESKRMPVIDLSVRVGSFVVDGIEPLKQPSLPFPFSYAIDALPKLSESMGTPWTPKLFDSIKRRLEDEDWCPPVLLAARGDQWDDQVSQIRASQQPQDIARLLTIAHPCDFFAAVYEKVDPSIDREQEMGPQGKKCVNAFEDLTYAKHRVQVLNQKWEEGAIVLSRLHMLLGYAPETGGARGRDWSSAYRVWQHFPADVLLQATGKYTRMTRHLIDRTYEEAMADELLYVLPSIALWTGSHLVDQPKMFKLVEDLAAILAIVQRVFQPLAEAASPLFHNLRRSKNSTERELNAANIRERVTGAIHNTLKREGTSLLGDPTVVFKNIGKHMANALFPNDPSFAGDKQEFLKCFDSWGWAMLMEYALCSTVEPCMNLLSLSKNS
jgi:hypothetical protein